MARVNNNIHVDQREVEVFHIIHNLSDILRLSKGIWYVKRAASVGSGCRRGGAINYVHIYTVWGCGVLTSSCQATGYSG